MLDKKEATPQAGPEIHLTALLNALPPGLVRVSRTVLSSWREAHDVFFVKQY